jgi:hypothetical protein
LQIRVRRIDCRFLLRDGDLKGFLVDLREKVAFVYATTSAFSAAADRPSRSAGGDIPPQNLKSAGGGIA